MRTENALLVCRHQVNKCLVTSNSGKRQESCKNVEIVLTEAGREEKTSADSETEENLLSN